MMRRTLFTLFLALPLLAAAQVRIGWLSCQAVMKQMPEYAQAQESLKQLKAQYDREATRGEEEFQRKFAEFLQGQKDFPQNILIKRQAELQALMESGMAFRKEAEQLLAQAEKDLLANVASHLDEAIRAVGVSGGYAFVLNTDGNPCPFVNPSMGEDVTLQVLQHLGLSAAPAAGPAAQQVVSPLPEGHPQAPAHIDVQPANVQP